MQVDDEMIDDAESQIVFDRSEAATWWRRWDAKLEEDPHNETASDFAWVPKPQWLCRSGEMLRRNLTALVSTLTALMTLAALLSAFFPNTSLGTPVPLTCRSWLWQTDFCGLNGDRCTQGQEYNWHAFKCPTGCAWQPVTHELRLDVYGGAVDSNGVRQYTPTSRVCPAAVHAGVVSGSHGGCAKFRFVPGKLNFEAGGEKNGVTGQAHSWHPQAVEFGEVDSSMCADVWPVHLTFLLLSVLLLTLAQVPTAVYYVCVISWVFWYEALNIGSTDKPRTLFDMMPTFLLLVLPVALVMYRCVSCTTVYPAQCHIKRLLWAAPVVVLSHQAWFTYFLPDLELSRNMFATSGQTVFALFVLLLAAIVIALQLRIAFKRARRSEEFRRTLYRAGALAACVLAVLVTVAASQSTYELHVHHYIIALLLWALTPFRHWTSCLIQGACIGMFIDGIVQWGPDPLFSRHVTPRFASFDVLTDGDGSIGNFSVILDWSSPANHQWQDELNRAQVSVNNVLISDALDSTRRFVFSEQLLEDLLGESKQAVFLAGARFTGGFLAESTYWSRPVQLDLAKLREQASEPEASKPRIRAANFAGSNDQHRYRSAELGELAMSIGRVFDLRSEG